MTECRAIAAAGFELTALVARYCDCGDFGIASAPVDFDSPFRLRSAPVFPTRPYPYSRFLSGVAEAIALSEPDGVLYWGEPSELAAAQVLGAAKRLQPEARLGAFVFENIDRQWRGKLSWLRGRAERRVLSDLDFAICATCTARDRLMRLGVPGDRCHVVYPQVDAELFRPVGARELRSELGLADRIVVGFCGRLVQEKGIDLLIDAVAELPDQYALLLVGGGREEGALLARAAESGMAGRVRHVDHVTRDEVPEYVCAMDMLVLPSRPVPQWQEQYGRVLPEAMLCGVPVIGSSSGAIPEVIGEAGLVFEQENVSALREAILRLGSDRSLRRELAEAGRERARTTFSTTYSEQLPAALRSSVEMPLRRRGN
jgi:glycosyltransferase involved in cell wall biosynthesis